MGKYYTRIGSIPDEGILFTHCRGQRESHSSPSKAIFPYLDESQVEEFSRLASNRSGRRRGYHSELVRFADGMILVTNSMDSSTTLLASTFFVLRAPVRPGRSAGRSVLRTHLDTGTHEEHHCPPPIRRRRVRMFRLRGDRERKSHPNHAIGQQTDPGRNAGR